MTVYGPIRGVTKAVLPAGIYAVAFAGLMFHLGTSVELRESVHVE